jgi:hypothetical protein
MRIFPGVATPVGLLDAVARRLSWLGPTVGFGWSSGCFDALADPALERVFLYEPPLGANRDATSTQRRHFVTMLGWRALGQRRLALQSFWRMVSAHDDGTAGFDQLGGSLRESVLAYREPFVRSLFRATGERGRRGPARVHVAVGSRSAAPMHRAVARLQPVDSVDRLAGLDHLAPLSDPEAIVRWVEGRC